MGDGASRGGCVVLISKSNEKAGAAAAEPMRSIRMRVGQRQITEYVGLFETDKRMRTSADGWGTFTCKPGSLEVWVPRITSA